MAAIPDLVPLFPLPNVVLFPHISLPLHVFEPRYRKMVADALSSHRTIGMVLLRAGWEGDYQGRPPIYSTGCAGTIVGSEELEGGRYNIVLRGASRFRVVQEHAGEPYRLARVEPDPEKPGDAARVEAVRDKVLAALSAGASEAMSAVLAQLPDDVFVNGLSQSLGFDPLERQSLLECDTIEERLARLLALVEFRALKPGEGSPVLH